MNANRRADLQRKLAVAPVPKPPAGLAAKIKSDIPKELRFSAERERARFAQSARVSLAVAASVIVVIASAYLALRVTDRSEVQPATTRPAASTTRALQLPAAAPPPPPPAAAAAPTAKEVRIARRRPKPQVEAKTEVAADQSARDAVREEPMAAKVAVTAAAPAVAAPVVAQNAAVEQQTTTSPISGKRYGFADARLTPWKDVPREVKIQILKDELAHGADPKEVARVAREAGLNEFADSIEKKP